MLVAYEYNWTDCTNLSLKKVISILIVYILHFCTFDLQTASSHCALICYENALLVSK